MSESTADKGVLKGTTHIPDGNTHHAFDTKEGAKSPDGGKIFVRKERSKSREGAKKMGGGKKGLWATPKGPEERLILDAGDPNYDSERDENTILVGGVVDAFDYNSSWTGPAPSLSMTEFKQRVADIITEYFASEDVTEVSRSVRELNSQCFNYELVKLTVTKALDRKEKERELASRLISALYEDILSRDDVAKGFERLLELADDLQVDAPSARGNLATFLARAVVDEVLPPAYLNHPVVNKLAKDIVEQAKLKLSIKHGIARIEKGWGPGDGRPVEELKAAVDQLMHEYLLSRDLSEGARCVKELNSPSFHPEIVKRGVVTALDKSEDDRQAMSSLFAYLVTAAQIVSVGHMKQGFDRLYSILNDLKLDVPRAAEFLNGFTERAIADACLPESYSPPRK